MFLKTLLRTLTCDAAILALTAMASPLVPRADTTFSLYAYGSESSYGIGGMPVFYKEGLAYVGNPTAANGTYISFTQPSGGHTWTVTPNTTLSPSASNFSEYFSLPSSFAPGMCQFGNSTSSSSMEYDVFSLVGTFGEVLLNNFYVSVFTANPTGTDGVWELQWNSTTGNPVVLKTTAPPSSALT